MLLLCIIIAVACFAVVWLAGEWADGDVNGPRPGSRDD